jgi:hypothetical protein
LEIYKNPFQNPMIRDEVTNKNLKYLTNKNYKDDFRCRCSSVIKFIHSMYKALDSTLSTLKNKKERNSSILEGFYKSSA